MGGSVGADGTFTMNTSTVSDVGSDTVTGGDTGTDTTSVTGETDTDTYSDGETGTDALNQIVTETADATV
jgi:hypothetical protein